MNVMAIIEEHLGIEGDLYEHLEWINNELDSFIAVYIYQRSIVE